MKKDFYYSQNSLNEFKRCPLKFKFKYIDGIAFKDNLEDYTGYYASLEEGLEFHLLCERYFKNIPLGIDGNHKFFKAMEDIKALNLKKYDTYPEEELILNKGILKLQGKYDLIVINREEKSAEIWDWKTEREELNIKNLKNRMQTLVYMYILREVIKEEFDLDIECKNLKMNYFKIGSKAPLTIEYSENRHEEVKEYLENLIYKIENMDFNFEDEYLNNKHCKYCDFKKICCKI